MLLALIPAATVAVPAISTAAPTRNQSVPPADPIDYDTFDKVTFNAVANGVEQPYTGGATSFSATFDTTNFTVTDAERANSPNYNGCIHPAPRPSSFAGRTAWVRFAPGNAGVISVRASASYDVVLIMRKSLPAPLGTNSLGTTSSLDCSDAGGIGIDERVGAVTTVCPGLPNCLLVDPAHIYYVQVGILCVPEGDPVNCANGVPPSGAMTTVQLDFKPLDQDGDGVADTTDVCPTVAGHASAQGCPDPDGDGVRNDNGADNCPTQLGVPAASPYNGCPAGPTPPQPPPAYVVITGLDGDVDNTNTIAVKLNLNWPQGAQNADITNGDGTFQTVTLGPESIDWQLRPLSGSAPSESRLVSVTYRGPGISNSNVVDAITLDTKPPALAHQRLYNDGDGWILALKAQDRGTGVASVALLTKAKKGLGKVTVCAKSNCPENTRQVLTSKKKKPRFARIVDAAGNPKVVKLVPRATACSTPPQYLVLKGNHGDYDCFKERDECSKTDGHLWSLSLYVRCRKGTVKVINPPLLLSLLHIG